MENYSQEFNDTLNEAMNVRIELESIMENAIQISQTIVDDVAVKISQTPEITTESETPNHPSDPKPAQEELLIAKIANLIPDTTQVEQQARAKPRRIRVYELARDLQISSKRLMELIKSLGININSHMNVLDDMQLRLIKQAIDADLCIDIDQKIITTDPISSKDPNKSAVKESVLDLVLDNESSFYGDNLVIANGSARKAQKPDDQPLQGLEFSIEELKAAHPYIAVKTMYENGYPIREIAKLLDRGQGEVSLILNLSKKKPAVM